MGVALGVGTLVWVVGVVSLLAAVGAATMIGELKADSGPASASDMLLVELDVRQTMARLSKAYLTEVEDLFSDPPRR